MAIQNTHDDQYITLTYADRPYPAVLSPYLWPIRKLCCAVILKRDEYRFLPTWIDNEHLLAHAYEVACRAACAMDKDIVVNHTAEIVDLKLYRERKITTQRASRQASAASYGQAPSLFAMPVVFFVYWPTWFFPSPLASAFSEGGSGAA